MTSTVYEGVISRMDFPGWEYLWLLDVSGREFFEDRPISKWDVDADVGGIMCSFRKGQKALTGTLSSVVRRKDIRFVEISSPVRAVVERTGLGGLRVKLQSP